MRGSFCTTNSNDDVSDPFRVFTSTGDVFTHRGAMAINFSGETTLNVDSYLPNDTEEVSSKFLPVIVTRVPSGPDVGEMLSMRGPGTDSSDANMPRIKISHGFAMRNNLYLLVREDTHIEQVCM